MNCNLIPHYDSPCLETLKLSLSYGMTSAFEGISLSVPREAVTAIIGPSGCGKSSFLMCLSRLIDLVPGARVSGGITLGNLDVLKPQTDVIELRRRVGMIFQKPNPFPLSIRKNLELPLREHITRDRRKMEQIIEETLKNVGLWNEVKDRLDRSALSLSGGQQQRLCLARALVLQPEVLLLDEPCSALDPLAMGVIEELIFRLKKRLTVLIVTHNLAQARRLADRVALFWVQNQRGCLIESGPAEQIFDDPQQETTAAYVTGQAG